MRRSLLCLSLASAYGLLVTPGVLAASPGGLMLAAAARPANPETNTPELYLEVFLNQATTGKLARFEMRDGQLWANPETMRDLGLRWPGSAQAHATLPLQSIPGLELRYDDKRQRVALQVPVAALDRPVAVINPPELEMPRVDAAAQLQGLVLNYDLYGQQANGTHNTSSLSGWSELRLMGWGQGSWGTTMVSRAASGAGADNTRGTVRLDTQWQRHFQDSMVSLTVGDTQTGAASWSRATRIGGIRLARNFALQPYRITAPLAMVQGEAVLPSTVDLYLNGLRQSSQQVQPGQFMLGGVPSINGLGMAQMVITDINGQQRTVNVPLYGSAQLMQAGLSDWSVELGSVRRDYGVRSFSYSSGVMASATGRYGWSDRITLEGHAEADADVRQMGVGSVWRLGSRAGVLNAAVATSQHGGQAGHQGSWGYQWSSDVFSVGLSSLRRDSSYRDVASLHGATLARGSDQLFAGTSTALGSFGAGLVRQAYVGGAQSRFANLSWSRQLPHQANLNVSAIRSLDGTRGTSVYVSLSVPLDRYVSVASSVRHSPGQTSGTVGASRSVPSDLGGWGWRAEAGVGDSRSAQAQVTRLEPFGQWSAGVAYLPGGKGAAASTTAYAGANGSVLWAQGQTYAMRQIDDAFALVSTDGVAGVPVRLENRLVGQTDANGYLLLNRLNAYQRNRLSIDSLGLPAYMHIDKVEADAVPESRGGVLARFAMRAIVAVQAALKDGHGQHLPAGSRIWLDAPQTPPRALVVGYDGLVYLEDPPAGAVLRWDSGASTCRVPLPAMSLSSGLVDIGVLVCN